ncbi:phophatidylserine decarboxylase associated domain-containing protein [Pseudoalteromonas sp. McH1-7]|uniref:phosphatidylserine decarboxylase family protein n=1 Tax=unclassified Pseudoalteromonas TaxID=194690 RepID=UPI000FFED492|nr:MULTISPECIES: phosphatidylserine decarboxylase family protein [unclassified Pseudoalteromonas]NUZ10378.1 phophatidylserine decarboxylase associated domain-containing protein [Pseudoalteromonas sp. McH1-7]RXE98502.1 phosphatidylserine decarboxylase [Pseudoalteromonas sp. PS5]USD27171.1 phophatidylserine decarboxylase associated domain-containing protein [Pseudoalteromonas sp. SCSIO 43201]
MKEIMNILRVVSESRQAEISPEDNHKVEQIVKWQKETLTQAELAFSGSYEPAVQALSDYLSCTPSSDSTARRFATQMLTEVPEPYRAFETLSQWLVAINYVIQRAPEFEKETFPMSKLFVFYMFVPSGNKLFVMNEFNARLTQVLQAWQTYLDSEESKVVLNPEGTIPAPTGWLSQSAQEQLCLSQAKNYADRAQTYWGFTSYNDFFHRELDLDTYRPLPANDSNKIVVSANDGTVYRIARDVQYCNQFWLKGQPYSLFDMLGGNAISKEHDVPTPSYLIEPFVGGDVMQSFLSGADYHRWHAPISGKVVRKQTIEGFTFSELRSEGFDASAGTESQGYQAMVNTRGIVFIEDEFGRGLVAVIPIGITEISSVEITVDEGQYVKKGQELGYFSYGGSTLALVFQRGMVASFMAEPASDDAQFPACKSAENCPAEKGCLRVRSAIAKLHDPQKC